MKKILYVLLAAGVLFACNKPQEQEVKPSDDPSNPSVVFEVDDVEPLSAEAQTLSVGVKTNVEFDVVVPAEVTWIKYLATKAAAPASEATKKTIEFSISLNEEDKMRQASVALNGKDGKTLKSIAIMQKAGGGIEIGAEIPVEAFPVEGGSFDVNVTSNVPFSAESEADWIKATAGEGKVTLELEPNSGIEPREGTVNLYREGTDNLIFTFTITQAEPHVILGDAGYADLASALEAYKAIADANATIILAKGTHVGDIVVGPDNAALTIQGGGEAVLDGTIEIKGKAVTIEGLTIAPSKEGSLPVFETSYNYQHGIMVHDAGLGVTITNVTIDMSKLAADATGIFLLGETAGWGYDKVRSCVVDGGSGHRLIQAYGAKASITGCTFKGPYSSYAVRVGNKDNDVVIANNTFEGTAGCAVHFNNLENSTITLGNGAKDNNKFEGTFEAPYKANTDVTAAGNSFAPAVEYAGGVVNVTVDPDAMESLSRVWGYYNGKTGSWDDAITACSNWNRNAVIVGDYVYVTIAGNADGQYGVAVFDLYDGTYIRTITNGFEREGRFWTCGIARMPGYDGDVIYVSNMAMSSDESTQKLMIYKLVDLDGEGIPTKAEIAMAGYDVPAGERFGDKMTSYGNEEDGLFFFVSFNKPGTYRTNMEFRIDAGAVASEPIISPYLGTAGGSTTASIHMFQAQGTGPNATRQALYGSNFDFRYLVTWWWGSDAPDGWYQTKVEDGITPNNFEPGDTGDGIYGNFTDMDNYDVNANDPIMFFLGSERYIAYVTVLMDQDSKSYGYLRLIHVPLSNDIKANYPVQVAMWSIRNNDACFQRYAIGDPDDYFAVGHETTNKTGFCDVLQTESGETYIMAGITSTGMSLFKVD